MTSAILSVSALVKVCLTFEDFSLNTTCSNTEHYVFQHWTLRVPTLNTTCSKIPIKRVFWSMSLAQRLNELRFRRASVSSTIEWLQPKALEMNTVKILTVEGKHQIPSRDLLLSAMMLTCSSSTLVCFKSSALPIRRMAYMFLSAFPCFSFQAPL